MRRANAEAVWANRGNLQRLRLGQGQKLTALIITIVSLAVTFAAMTALILWVYKK
jgi:hypothetical protein